MHLLHRFLCWLYPYYTLYDTWPKGTPDKW